MPILTLPLSSNSKRPIIPNVFIGDAKEIPAPNLGNSKPVSISIKGALFRALLDTGASRTCISKKVVDTLGLPSVGQTTINSASHAGHVVSCYTVIVRITHQQVINKKVSPEGKIVSQDIVNSSISRPHIIEVVDFEAVGQEVDALIGMDLISTGLIVLSGPDKRLTISF